MRSRLAVLGIVMFGIAGSPPLLAAQARAVLQHIVGKPRVRIHLEDGNAVAGRFASLAGDTVRIDTPTGSVLANCQKIDTVWVEGTRWKAGAIAGGVATGALVFFEFCRDLSCTFAQE